MLTHPIVGFDLDMTLVDSAAGIVATFEAVFAETGRHVAAADIRALIGVELTQTFRQLAPDLDDAAAAEHTARYRELYPTLGIPQITLLPYARDAVNAVHHRGGSVMVVSTKIERAVLLVLDHVDLHVDEIAGGLFGADKGHLLRERGADVYVGDHPGDVLAAQVADARSIAVATGPHDEVSLKAAGADVVLPDLRDFAATLDHLLATAEQG